MCCLPSKCCCFLLVLIIVLIGFVFGWGVFAHGFHKLKDNIHLETPNSGNLHGRPFLGIPAPAPF